MEEKMQVTEQAQIEKLKKLGFSDDDLIQVYSHGLRLEDIDKQLHFLKRGIRKRVVIKPALKLDGIWVLTKPELISYIGKYENGRSQKKIMKFVPASGAASRMFRFLSRFLVDFDVERDTVNGYVNKKGDTDLQIFIAGLEKFPFYQEVKKVLKTTYGDLNYLNKEERIYYFVKTLLEAKEFDYLNKPKAVLPFHRQDGRNITPIEEHLKEAAMYANSDGKSAIHFTISEGHEAYFKEVLNEVLESIEKQYEIQIEISFSVQNSKTDSIAVDSQLNPFRTETGKLLFRPGGHGALLENLNALDADIIFIKNIDNVTNGQSKKLVAYKKGLAGILLSLQQKIHQYLHLIEQEEVSDLMMHELIRFLEKEINIKFPNYFQHFKESSQLAYIKKILDRPIRVCGMVKNEGEPGGGPFWVEGTKGWTTLRIVETSQMDIDDYEQSKIIGSSTHFNPVDIVCGVKNYNGEKFDLRQFVDANSGFVVEKNYKGKTLKSYELPGLWNGAMGDWITVFVEVPLVTFNPVKTINDLLNSSHLDE